jgi:hypothetical protein
MPATKPDETINPTSKRVARPQVSFLVSSEMKAQIDQVAQNEGCSFGRAVELIVQKYFLYKQTIDDMRATVSSVQGAETRLIETQLFYQGWSPILAKGGEGEAAKRVTLWAPPDTPFPLRLEKTT